MKRLLIATILAASTLGLAGIAMAQTQFGGNSSGSFAAQQAAQYNTGNGE